MLGYHICDGAGNGGCWVGCRSPRALGCCVKPLLFSGAESRRTGLIHKFYRRAVDDFDETERHLMSVGCSGAVGLFSASQVKASVRDRVLRTEGAYAGMTTFFFGDALSG